MKLGRKSFLLLVFLVFLKNLGFYKFVNELLHGIEGGKEALGRHDDADVALTRGRLAFFFRLKSHEVETDHAACEVDLPDAVCEDFFFSAIVVPFVSVLCYIIKLLLPFMTPSAYLREGFRVHFCFL